jgi:hypothetical protein
MAALVGEQEHMEAALLTVVLVTHQALLQAKVIMVVAQLLMGELTTVQAAVAVLAQ